MAQDEEDQLHEKESKRRVQEINKNLKIDDDIDIGRTKKFNSRFHLLFQLPSLSIDNNLHNKEQNSILDLGGTQITSGVSQGSFQSVIF